jgi:hypothetical protein
MFLAFSPSFCTFFIHIWSRRTWIISLFLACLLILYVI